MAIALTGCTDSLVNLNGMITFMSLSDMSSRISMIETFTARARPEFMARFSVCTNKKAPKKGLFFDVLAGRVSKLAGGSEAF